MIIEFMILAPFIVVYANEIKLGDAHAFFVNYTKYQIIDELKNI